MKSILMSIQPQWVEKILKGKKTIEIRKTAPKETPFKVYVYCTSVKQMKLSDYTILHRDTDGMVDYWHGKVVAEFICDSISNFDLDGLELYQMKDHLLRFSNLTEAELKSYIGNGIGKALHISDLKIYDKPRELEEFCTIKKEKVFGNAYAGKHFMTVDKVVQVTRPPQSWMYAKEASDGNAVDGSKGGCKCLTRDSENK